jgi:transposase
MVAKPRSSSNHIQSCAPQPIFIGVDVSKDWIDIADGSGRCIRVPNAPAAIAKAFRGPWSCCENLVCEATGGYERALMKVASDLGLPLRRIHPNRVRAFARATGRLAKTDALDASILARYAAFTAKETPAPLPSAKAQQLADTVSRLTQLKDLRQAETCRAKRATDLLVKQSLAVIMAAIDGQIETVQKALDALIAADPVLSRKADLIRSCKGVGPRSAQAILAMLPEIGTLDRRRVAALVGVAPIDAASGSSLHRAKIGGGRKALRDILFMAALSASSHNPTFKQFYERLRSSGKPHKVALIAVLRKLIVTLNAMIKSDQPFKSALT